MQDNKQAELFAKLVFYGKLHQEIENCKTFLGVCFSNVELVLQ